MTSSAAPLSGTLATDVRNAPRLGGFNWTAIGLDIRRVLRNRRTLMFTVVLPNIFFFMFGLVGRGERPGGAMAMTLIMLNMAVYGAMVSTTAGGAAVALDRALGWSRQLRLTPLAPWAYIAMKVIVSMSIASIAITSTYIFGSLNGVHLSASEWLFCGLASWGASFVFAAFGLFMGFLLPSDNVMQFVGPLLAIMAMFGGIFIPIKVFPPSIQTAAHYSPMFGVGTVARAPLTGEITAWAVGSIVVWTLVFGAAAMLLFRRDTQRV